MRPAQASLDKVRVKCTMHYSGLVCCVSLIAVLLSITLLLHCRVFLCVQDLANTFALPQPYSGPANFATRSSLICLRAARECLFMPPWNAQSASFHASSERTEYLRINAAPPGCRRDIVISRRN